MRCHIFCQSCLKSVWFSARKSSLAPAFQIRNLLGPLWYFSKPLYRSLGPVLCTREAAWHSSSSLLIASHCTVAPVNRAREAFPTDQNLLYKENSRINTASLQNTWLWLLYSHLYLDQSNTQLLSQLFAGDGVPALNLWIFQHSSPFQRAACLWFGIAIVHAYSAGTLKNLAKSCCKNWGFLFMFSLKKNGCSQLSFDIRSLLR